MHASAASLICRAFFCGPRPRPSPLHCRVASISMLKVPHQRIQDNLIRERRKEERKKKHTKGGDLVRLRKAIARQCSVGEEDVLSTFFSYCTVSLILISSQR